MRRLAGFLAAAVLVTGCGLFGDDGDGSGTAPERTSLAALLNFVPDTAVNRGHVIFYVDAAAVRAGTTSASGADDLQLLLDRSSNSIFMPTNVRDGILKPEWYGYAGFDSRNIDAAIEFGALPEDVEVLVGDFDVPSLESALRTSPGGDALASDDVNGTTYLSLGEGEGLSFDNVSAIRRVGQPLIWGVGDGSLVWARSRNGVDNAVVASGNSSGTLAQNEQYRSIADVLDQQQVAHAALVTGEATMRWQVAGMGETFTEGGGSTLVVVMSFGTDTAAAEAVDAFRAHIQNDTSSAVGSPWASTLTIQDVHADGRLVIATMTSTDAGIAMSVAIREDNLLAF
ncbi:MAG: hypothetical protein R2694_06335 [Ilumatobacteraceae bacterium]|nr:hypothetical protein [Ilumatobacter sp.]MCB0985578.1 hypothetical protein [Ilumatobacter sp.]